MVGQAWEGLGDQARTHTSRKEACLGRAWVDVSVSVSLLGRDVAQGAACSWAMSVPVSSLAAMSVSVASCDLARLPEEEKQPISRRQRGSSAGHQQLADQGGSSREEEQAGHWGCKAIASGYDR